MLVMISVKHPSSHFFIIHINLREIFIIRVYQQFDIIFQTTGHP